MSKDIPHPEGRIFEIHIPEKIKNITHVLDSGKLLIDLPALKARGVPFDGVWVGEESRTHLQQVVPVQERRLQLPENVFVVSSGSFLNLCENLMKEITQINSDYNTEDIRARYNYQKNLNYIFEELGYQLVRGPQYKFNPEKTVFFAPQRGADLIQAYFQSQGIIANPDNIVNYELKREYLPDGVPVVGRIDTYYPKGEFETGVFIDDCLASDASASASIVLMKEKYPNLKNISIVVSAATRRGLEELAKKNPDINIIAATEVYAMNNHFYLLRTPEETDKNGRKYSKDKDVFYVGDMGAWAEKLPDTFNKIAPWNRFRS